MYVTDCIQFVHSPFFIMTNVSHWSEAAKFYLSEFYLFLLVLQNIQKSYFQVGCWVHTWQIYIYNSLVKYTSLFSFILIFNSGFFIHLEQLTVFLLFLNVFWYNIFIWKLKIYNTLKLIYLIQVMRCLVLIVIINGIW